MYRLMNGLRQTSYVFLMGLLISQMIVPAHLVAQQQDKSSNHGPIQADPNQRLRQFLEAAYEEAGQQNGAMVRDVVANNRSWLRQELVHLATQQAEALDATYDYRGVDLDRPKISPQLELIQRGLGIEALPGNIGLQLTLKGYKYAHHIYFPDGITLVDFDFDSERVDVLLSDGRRYQMILSSMPYTLFQANIPNFDVGLAKGVDGLRATKVKIIKRRSTNPDKSRKPKLANLNFNDSQLEQQIFLANDRLVTDMGKNLDRLTPVEIHPKWQTLGLEIAKDRARKQAKIYGVEAEEPTELVHTAGNTLLITEVDGREVMIREVDFEVDAACVNLQISPMMAMWTLASKDFAHQVQEIAAAQGNVAATIKEIMADPEAIQAFYSSDIYEVFAQLPVNALKSVHAYTSSVVKERIQADAKGVPNSVRDRFTPSEHLEDFSKLQTQYEAVKASAEIARSRHKLDPRRYEWTRRIGLWASKIPQRIDIPKRIRAATSMLKAGIKYVAAPGAAASLADYTVSGGVATQFMIHYAAGILNYTRDHLVPILNDPRYALESVAYSDSVRIASIFAILGGFAIAKGFSQLSLNQLITFTGIKYLFAASITPPQLVFSWLTATPKALESAKNGYLPWFQTLPIVSFFTTKKTSKIINEKNRLKNLSTALAIHGVAATQDVPVGDLIDQLAKDPKSQKEVKEVAAASAFILGHVGQKELGEQLGKAMSSEPETFVETWQKSVGLAKSLAEPGIINTAIRKIAVARVVATQQVMRTTALAGDATFRQLMNPQPTEEYSNYVVGSWIVDGIMSIFVSSKVGKYANPEVAELLAYQPSHLTNVHQELFISDMEQHLLHLGSSAGNDYLSSAAAGLPRFQQYRPAGFEDYESKAASRSMLYDSYRFASLTFNPMHWRKNNFFTLFGIRSFSQCVTLIQGMVVIGAVLRTLEPVLLGDGLKSLAELETWEKAFVGQTYFIYFAPFSYRWVWAVVLSSNRALNAEISELSGDFRAKYAEFVHLMSQRNFDKARQLAHELVALYSEKIVAVPQDILDALAADVDTEAWLQGLLKALQNHPPVPESVNGIASKGLIFTGSVVTTILATYLMSSSFDVKSVWGEPGDTMMPGFDEKDLVVLDFMRNGTSPHDSLPSLMAKSLANVGAIWGFGHAVNLTSDAIRMARAKRGTTEETAAVGSLRNSIDGIKNMPVVRSFRSYVPENSGIGGETPCEPMFRESLEQEERLTGS